MLEVRKLGVSYGQHRALADVSLSVGKGEIVVILGANGAGKSSLLRAIGGMSEGDVSGDVLMDGVPISRMPPHEIVEQGIALVPEGRGVFADMTVQENLALGAYAARARVDQQQNMDRVLSLFPKLVERKAQTVRTMSGGEQQMVAIGRAMMSAPAILMLDEPSLGLSPLLCKELFHNLAEVQKTGLGILLVEQNAKQSLAIADRGYLLENAHIIGEDDAACLANDPAVQKAYLGVASDAPAARPTALHDHHAEAGVAEKQALSFISAGSGLARTRTDDIVAGGIDELVRHAANLQSEHIVEAREARQGYKVERKTVPETYLGPGNELATVLSEMEKAAADARLPTPEQRSEASKPEV
ncbi:MAG: ABC transporter ATP-binding protein, partial [Alphaproteobacteria bacterium]|nr:ABC transporter ATP-binding protein [Alphaproteobacteria bacterium]